MFQVVCIIFRRISINFIYNIYFFVYSLIHATVVIFIKYDFLTHTHRSVSYNVIYIHLVILLDSVKNKKGVHFIQKGTPCMQYNALSDNAIMSRQEFISGYECCR